MPRRNLPEGRSQARDRLLAAAFERVRKNGMGDISLRQLAADLGTSHRMLDYHFGSKVELLVAIVGMIEAVDLKIFSELRADAHLPPIEQIWRMWEHVTHPAQAAGQRLWFEIYGQALQGRPHTVGLLPEVVDSWIEPLSEPCARLGSPTDLQTVDARLLLAVVRGLIVDVLVTGDRAGVNRTYLRFLDFYQQGASGAGIYLRPSITASAKSRKSRPNANKEPSPRDRLLTAALEYAREYGIGEITLRKLAEKIGTSHRMLIYHFGSREGLLGAIVSAVEAPPPALLVPLAAGGKTPPIEQLLQMWQVVADPLRQRDNCLWWEVFGQALQGKAHASELKSEFVLSWLQPLDAICQQAGSPPYHSTDDARLIAAVYRGLCLDLAGTAAFGPTTASLERFIALYLSAVSSNGPRIAEAPNS